MVYDVLWWHVICWSVFDVRLSVLCVYVCIYLKGSFQFIHLRFSSALISMLTSHGSVFFIGLCLIQKHCGSSVYCLPHRSNSEAGQSRQ